MKHFWELLLFGSLFFSEITAKAIVPVDEIDDNEVCKKCRSVTSDLITKRLAGASKEEMFTVFKDLCMQYMLIGEEFCNGIVNKEIDTALYIIDNRRNLTGARVCAIYLQYKMCIDPDLPDWTVKIPDKSSDSKTVILSHSMRFNTNKIDLKVLHLSDFHFDANYKPGSNSKCSEVLCCRDNSGNPVNPEDAAGYWGSYGMCDIPWHTVEEILNRIKEAHKDIDFVYFTGDIISHTSYETSVENNTRDLKKLYGKLKETFGSTPVYPVIGNHESDPPDFFAPSNITGDLSSQWLYDLTIDQWSSWVPINEVASTLKKGGFYSFVIKPGYRLIALNNNLGYSNLWTIYDDVDQYGELQWLVDTLYEAEKNGEYVHIIGHLEPGESAAFKTWFHQYYRILRRFTDTIKAQINGHTHLDEFRIIYDEKDAEKVVHYSFVGGSATTFVGYNPNYRIYSIDSKSFQVVDYVQYTFNLTEANLSPNKPPSWYEQYNFLKEYDLDKISPESMGQLFKTLSANETWAYKYFTNHIRNSDYFLDRGCDSYCLKQTLCRINSTEFEDASKCVNMMA